MTEYAISTNSADARTRLIRCFREVFPKLGEEQIVTAEHAQLEEWDSLASLTLVAVIEDEFETRLSDDLVAELTSFDRILAAVSDVSPPE